VRALVFRFEAFSRPVRNIKKLVVSRSGEQNADFRFEEGVFSDLRNLKPGTDACLEEPKSAHIIEPHRADVQVSVFGPAFQEWLHSHTEKGASGIVT
jgi:hypothetical protein